MPGLRVIRGKVKGFHLKAVPGDSTRPITDRVKEALFNILGSDVLGSTWLDLFGGTGSVGIEALSGGATFIRFNDLNKLAVQTIRSNLTHTGFSTQAEIWHMDAFALLHKKADRQFDYVYIAPPQYQDLWKRALLGVDQNTGWLAEHAWVIVQINPKEYEPLSLENLQEFDQRQYGDTLLVFYERRSADGVGN